MDQEVPWETLERVAERAERAVTAWGERSPEGTPHPIRTSRGEVVLDRVERRTDPTTGVDYVEVRLAGQTQGGDPLFRVVNPPLLVEDPEGPVEARGRRWREDPLAALAEVIGRNGGAQVQRRRARM